MVGAPAATGAIKRAQALPNLRVGLHVVLVDGEALSERHEIPDLLDRRGRLRNDLATLGAQIALSPTLRRQVEIEISAQFETYRATGLALDHVNAHRHFHLHPVVADSVMRIGKQYGMRGLRVPVEPWRIIAEIEPHTQRQLGRITAPWAKWLRRSVRRAGLKTADAVFGLAWSGAMTQSRLAALLRRLPPGAVEIYLHPATTSDFAGAAPGYRYSEEFAALRDPDCIAAARGSGYALGGYADIDG